MNLKARGQFVFHNVGQGLFVYSANIEYGNEFGKFSCIYDCGSEKVSLVTAA